MAKAQLPTSKPKNHRSLPSVLLFQRSGDAEMSQRASMQPRSRPRARNDSSTASGMLPSTIYKLSTSCFRRSRTAPWTWKRRRHPRHPGSS